MIIFLINSLYLSGLEKYFFEVCIIGKQAEDTCMV